MMEGFRTFLESEEHENVKAMISKLPLGHQKLLDGYKFKYTPGNTLKGDDEHIGYIHKDKIVVAAPWNYGREFTTLHEIAHLVFEYKMTSTLKKEWSSIVKKTKKEMGKSPALNQNDEEIFAMTYASVYAKHPPTTYHNEERFNFIKKLPK